MVSTVLAEKGVYDCPSSVAELWKWLDVSIRIAQSIVEDNRITAGGAWYTVLVTFSIMLHGAPGETDAGLPYSESTY